MTEKKMTLKERLDLAALDADAAMEKLLSGELDRAGFRREVRAFTLAKFFLTEDEVAEVGTEMLLELANVSVEKMLRNADKSVKLAASTS